MAQKKQIIIPAPNGRLITTVSPTLIGDNDIALAENVERVSDRIRKTPGSSSALTTISGAVEPKNLYNFIDINGTERFIVYDYGTDGAEKYIYAGTLLGGAWTWTKIATAAGDIQLTSASPTPAFITARGYLFFSNGGTTGSYYGLFSWTGTGDAVEVHSTGNTAPTGKYLAYFKERLVVANGAYTTDGGTNWTTIKSGIMYSSITDSSGTPGDMNDAAYWHEIGTTFNEIEPNDGSEITALWVWQGRIYVAKETGIWVMYGAPKDFTIEKVTNIGMQSQYSLAEFEGQYIFRNNDGWHRFDGMSQPQLIDRDIRNLSVLVPEFNVGQEGDIYDEVLEDAAGWTAASSGSTSHLATTGANLTHPLILDTQSYSVEHSGTEVATSLASYYGYAFRLTDTIFCTSVQVRLYTASTPTSGTINAAIYKNSPYGQEMATTTIAASSLPTTSGTYVTFDFSSDTPTVDSTEDVYWCVMWWTDASDDPVLIPGLSIYTYTATVNNYIAYRPNTQWGWIYVDNLRVRYNIVGTKYYDTGTYLSTATDIDFGVDFNPDTDRWGVIRAVHTDSDKLTYTIRTSTNGTTYVEAAETIYPTEHGIVPVTTKLRRYILLQITFAKVTNVSSPTATSIEFNGFDTSSSTDRLIRATVVNDRYECATNINKDGTYRTFVLDKNGGWSIKPNQLIRGYATWQNEPYFITIDTNASIHRIYRGVNDEEYYYDYAAATPNSNTRYLLKVRSKKYDFGEPNYYKLFKEMQFSIGSIFGTNYVQGTLLYRTDDNDWSTVYFQDDSTIGDSHLIRHIFPAGTRGQYIQFEWQTYLSGTDYSAPYSIKDSTVEFYVELLKSVKKTQTSALTDTGHLVTT